MDDAVALFKTALNMAHITATTTCEVKYRPDRLPDVLKALICQRGHVVRVTMLSQSAEDKLALNRLHRRIRKRLMVHFNNKLESKLYRTSEMGGSNRSFFWKFAKRIKNRGLTPLPLLHEGNIVVESDENKATLFVNVLAIQAVASCSLYSNDDSFPQLSLHLPVNYEPLYLVYADQVQAIIEALPKRKAPGPNGITNEMLKKMSLIGIHYLYLLLKSSMLLGAFQFDGRRRSL
ncbi:hypothetical protein Zmor_024806 [Zophobas morio]|uniref:Uncharacterized protein n=1 Tax=Zophobas morio TaxID=2755281 RepID=A0AA38LZQ8_9CUCU|nr:hypothetical protein Zmor_024806 [Zophobas morio]